jgi:hypothetical protein
MPIDTHSEIGRNALLEIRRVILTLVILFTPAIVGSQTQAPENSAPVDYVQQSPPPSGDPDPALPPDKPMAVTPDPAPGAPIQNKKDDSGGQQTKRMLWVIPNFGAVNANTQLPPLSTREKFVLAAQDSVVDYSSYTWAGILAGQAMLLNSDPELGRGVKGYGRYYWRTFTDGV